MLITAALVGAMYGRVQAKHRYSAIEALETTTIVLGNIQVENAMFVTESELMEQGWSISEDDLTFGEVIGKGGGGCVYKGSWGHVPVAIKVCYTASRSDESKYCTKSLAQVMLTLLQLCVCYVETLTAVSLARRYMHLCDDTGAARGDGRQGQLRL